MDKLGYLWKFVILHNGQTVMLHDPSNGIYNIHMLTQSLVAQIRIKETPDKIRFDQDGLNRSAITSEPMQMGIYVKKSSLSLLDAYYTTMQEAIGWPLTLYKVAMTGTVTMTCRAKLQSAPVIEPVRKLAKDMQIQTTFILIPNEWSQA